MDNKIRCSGENCSEPWFLACEHGYWCIGHVTAHRYNDEECRVLLGRAIVTTLKALKPLAALQENLLPAKCVLADLVSALVDSAIYKNYLPIMRLEYEEAGAPYGLNDEGVWRWAEEQFELPEQ